jgi:uncharacterized protein (TIGR00369 family)
VSDTPPPSAFHDPDAGRSVARYLGLTLQEVGPPTEGAATVLGAAPVRAYLRNSDGSIAMGALLGLADSVAGLCGGLAALPGWVVSTNLMVRAVRLDVTGPLDLHAGVLRAGRRAVVTSVEITDRGAAGELVADGALTSAVLVPAGGAPAHVRPLRLEAPAPTDDLPPLAEFLGITARDATTIAVELDDHLRNPWGILHGGATAALVDLAGRHATGGAATTDAALHFIAPTRSGPVTTTVEVVGERADGALLRVEVRDEGAGDRVTAVGVTTVR